MDGENLNEPLIADRVDDGFIPCSLEPHERNPEGEWVKDLMVPLGKHPVNANCEGLIPYDMPLCRPRIQITYAIFFSVALDPVVTTRRVSKLSVRR
jgi:hypothetical protein